MHQTIQLRLLGKRLTGQDLKLFFGPTASGKAEKVLVLTNIAAFREFSYDNVDTYVLEIRDGQTVYGLDMSMRLGNIAIKDYPEVFLFVGSAGVDHAFRAVAEKAEYGNISELSKDTYWFHF